MYTTTYVCKQAYAHLQTHTQKDENDTDLFNGYVWWVSRYYHQVNLEWIVAKQENGKSIVVYANHL